MRILMASRRPLLIFSCKYSLSPLNLTIVRKMIFTRYPHCQQKKTLIVYLECVAKDGDAIENGNTWRV